MQNVWMTNLPFTRTCPIWGCPIMSDEHFIAFDHTLIHALLYFIVIILFCKTKTTMLLLLLWNMYIQTTSSQSRRTEMVYENISGPFLSHLWSQIVSTAAKGTIFFWIYSTETFDLWESFSSTVYKTVSSWIGTKTIIEQNDPKFVQLKHKRRIACIYPQTFNRPTEAAMPAYIWRKITGDINHHQASNKWI